MTDPAVFDFPPASAVAERPLNLFESELHRPLSSLTQCTEDEEIAKEHAGDYELGKAEVVDRLRLIYSPAQLVVDLDEALAIKHPGLDLAVFQAESFRCRPTEEVISHIHLVLKRHTCIDRRMYDIKVYEMDTFMRFMNHPCVVSLYAMWNEPVNGPYAFKTLVGLYREGVRGDLHEYAVDRPDGRRLRPSRIKFLGCNIASALRSFHNCNLIHAGIRPRSIYVDEARVALVGEFGKVELDSLRYSHHLFSKLFIANAIRHKLAYWAPELITMQQYGKEIDCWALGVTIYQMVTGTLPWPTESEDAFRQAVIAGSKGLSFNALERLGVDEVLRETVENLLHPNPLHRWTAEQTLAYLQFDFAVEIQRTWRGLLARARFRGMRDAIVTLQAQVRGVLARQRVFPQSHFVASALAITDAVQREVETHLRHGVAPQSARQEARAATLEEGTDVEITESDLAGGAESRSVGSSRSSSQASVPSSRVLGSATGIGVDTDTSREVLRLQTLLQARDVQLSILMKMLAEADATSVQQRQRITMLEQQSS